MNTKLNTKTTIMISGAFLIFGFVFFRFGMFYQQWDRKIIEDKLRKPYSCPLAGEVAKDDFLDVYIVKNGDSLLSIARDQIGDVSRVNEIIGLNENKFRLSKSNTFIEVGWKLYLPTIKSASGKLSKYNGEVSSIDGHQIALITRDHMQDTSVGVYEVPLKTEGNAKFQDLKVGDCLTVISDWGYSPNYILRMDYQK